jgi:hypothetical protein
MHQQEFGSDTDEDQNVAKRKQRTPPHLGASEPVVAIVDIEEF